MAAASEILAAASEILAAARDLLAAARDLLATARDLLAAARDLSVRVRRKNLVLYILGFINSNDLGSLIRQSDRTKLVRTNSLVITLHFSNFVPNPPVTII